MIDAESQYEGKYAAAQQYVTALRAAVGPAYPIGLTSFPYVDYHPRLPYSVFLGPGRRAGQPAAGLLEGHRRDRRRRLGAHTLANNRIYGTPIAPLGQTYGNPAAEDLARFRSLWAAYGSAGLSWWSWQATGEAEWGVLAQPLAARPRAAARPGLAGAVDRATRATRSCGCSSTSRPSTRP